MLATLRGSIDKIIPSLTSITKSLTRNVGAYAELFDISCFAKDTSFFVEIPKLAIDSWESVPSNLNISKIISTLLKSQNPDIFGKEFSALNVSSLTARLLLLLAQHYFVPGPSGVGLDAKWDATSQSRFDRNPHAFVLATKVDQAASPDGNQNIDWVYLKAIDGDLARQVYRTNTQLGQPPAKVSPSFVKPSWTKKNST